MADLCVSPGNRGDCRVCMGKGPQDGGKASGKASAAQITYDRIATDNQESFAEAFAGDYHDIEKRYTKGIEGKNCRLCHRVRRSFRRNRCFSKLMFNTYTDFQYGLIL